MCIRDSNESVVNIQGRATQGSRAMKLLPGDSITQILLVNKNDDDKLLVMTTGGYAKATSLKEYKAFDNKSVRGYAVIKKSAVAKNGSIVGAVVAREGKTLLMVTEKGNILCIDSQTIKATGRTTSGIRAAKLASNDAIVKIAAVDKIEGVAPSTATGCDFPDGKI